MSMGNPLSTGTAGGGCSLSGSKRDWLSVEDADKFQPIRMALTAMTDRKDANLWTPSPLREAEGWAEIRALATTALLDL